MFRTRRQPSTRPRETIEPPTTGGLPAGMITVTLLVTGIGSPADSVMALVGLLVFLPAAAAALCTMRQTALVCAWTVLLGSVAFVVGGGQVTPADRVLLLVLTVCLAAASLYACHRRIHGERAMLRLHSAAVAMQRQILHPLPGLYAQVRKLRWRDIPLGHRTRDHAHHRDEIRRLKVAAFSHLDYPGTRRAIQVVRWRRDLGTGKLTIERVYLITSLSVFDATCTELAIWIRGHWGIEVRHEALCLRTGVRDPRRLAVAAAG